MVNAPLPNSLGPEEFDDIQGNILRGYRSGLVRHLILKVVDRKKARLFLKAAAGVPADLRAGAASSARPAQPSGVPAITRATLWNSAGGTRPESFFNIGITCEGLRALGASSASLKTFPPEFREGMSSRAGKLGDFGESAAAQWPTPFDQPDDVHLIASIYANDDAALGRVETAIGDLGQHGFERIGVREGRGLADGKVFFGYRDGISQPNFGEEVNSRRSSEQQVRDPLGTVLLGYETGLEGLVFRVPQPEALGRNGSFNAFRVLAQDVFAFEAFLDAAAKALMDSFLHPKGSIADVPQALPEWLARFAADRQTPYLREFVAAQMCGRWRDGVPFETEPDRDPFNSPTLNAGEERHRLFTNFDYGPDSVCPAGAHIRRGNPRGGQIVQRAANYTRRIVRRGMAYGPDFTPGQPKDGEERGLLGNFICASLSSQFEAVMSDWINLGLQDPTITGDNDPLLGANSAETSRFVLKLPGGAKFPLHGLPRFIQTRGGAYTFLPGLTAIRYLASLTT